MEKFTFENDIQVFCVKAASFPDGVEDAHHTLHDLVPFVPGVSKPRRFFAISWRENGEIVYYAAAEQLEDGEAEKHNCMPFTIRKGQYMSETIHDYMKNIPMIGQTFAKLLALPDLDPNGYCLEMYLNPKDILLMVPLK
jgi:hypothetical protein